ncbi:hypothetical protein OGAPHI_003570 [Ogataea philodendri]|uniref:DNA-directed RNA polymerase III subunit n=2 Tax=Saccharomycotina TaxID=147537 RepID=A0A9P8T450_9ASCO|nr:uncharacterized protein OGAPHI_003570 [Ogataea philodendri]KAH3665386.1 hypothetical protein OGAPHI_003570 [Ogataea philodendri]
MAFSDSRSSNGLPTGLSYADVSIGLRHLENSNLLPVYGKPSSKEMEETSRFSQFCEIINTSYFCSNDLSLAGNIRDSQNSKHRKASLVGSHIERYSDRYKRRNNKNERSYKFHSSSFLPEELKTVTVGRRYNQDSAKEFALISNPRSLQSSALAFSAEEKQKRIAEKINNVDEIDEDIVEGEEEEEEEDDEFEEEDDDDYNAEKYFDDGEVDYLDDDGDDEIAF